MHNLVFLWINTYLISDWLEFWVFVMCINSVYAQIWLTCSQFLKMNAVVVSLLTFIFSLNEKVRKELFILNFTNSKSKKQLMKVYNSSKPCVILSKDGCIQMCNE